jgi:hypothetical protein
MNARPSADQTARALALNVRMLAGAVRHDVPFVCAGTCAIDGQPFAVRSLRLRPHVMTLAFEGRTDRTRTRTYAPVIVQFYNPSGMLIVQDYRVVDHSWTVGEYVSSSQEFAVEYEDRQPPPPIRGTSAADSFVQYRRPERPQKVLKEYKKTPKKKEKATRGEGTSDLF